MVVSLIVENGTAIDVPSGIPAVISCVLPALIGTPISESAKTVEVVDGRVGERDAVGQLRQDGGQLREELGRQQDPASTGCSEINCGLVTDVGSPSAPGSATSPFATDSYSRTVRPSRVEVSL